ncbi:MAG: enoyl-CoA hydratase-related protein [Steroidobacteraceae bacterium]
MTDPATADAPVLLFERVDEHIALVTLNRPEKRHAINGALARAIDAAVKTTESDPGIWVTVLTCSGGPTFCAGADLSEVVAGRGHELSTPDGGFAGFVRSKRAKPWIVAIPGSALGGGLEISLACDLRVCADTSVLGLPEVKRGLFAGAGGVYRLPRQLPRAIALEMIALGEPLDAARALHFGLVNAVVPQAEVLPRALDYARRICENAPLSVRESLVIARVAAEMREAELEAMNDALGQRLGRTRDFAEGPRAFLEKRKPQWSGS